MRYRLIPPALMAVISFLRLNRLNVTTDVTRVVAGSTYVRISGSQYL
jgi:hypothetical protein